jgi:hypothetical protein
VRYLFAVLVALFAFAAQAQSTKQTETRWDEVVTYDPATITTGTAFTFPTSGTLDTGTYASLACEVSVTAGNTRSVIPKCYAELAGTTLTFTYPTMTVAAAAQGRYVFDPLTSSATADTGVTDSPNRPCRFLKITAASAGEGTLSCTLRRR